MYVVDHIHFLSLVGTMVGVCKLRKVFHPLIFLIYVPNAYVLFLEIMKGDERDSYYV